MSQSDRTALRSDQPPSSSLAESFADRSVSLDDGAANNVTMFPHATLGEQLLDSLGSNRRWGLESSRVRESLERNGPNRLAAAAQDGWLAIFARQLSNAMIGLLAGAALISFVIGETLDAVVILGIVVANAVWGALQEGRAEAAAQHIHALLSDSARVIRDRYLREIDVEQIVVGDIVLLGAGERVPTDGRWLETVGVEVDESALTGEALPVVKRAEPPVEHTAALADRKTMAFAGTIVVGGQGVLLVTATGTQTEMGRIVDLSQEQPRMRTPLQVRLDRFASTIWQVAVVICVCLAGVAWLYGQPVGESLLIGVSLAVAAVPEGLPAVVTIALAIGIRRMAERAVIVRRLSAIEALGSTTVICADKTGTVTSGSLKLVCAYSCEDGKQVELNAVPLPSEIDPLLADSVLASTPQMADKDGEQRVLNSITERAIFTAAAERGTSYTEILTDLSVIAVKPFDSARKRMSVTVENSSGEKTSYVKGAPELLLQRVKTDHRRSTLSDIAQGWASNGKRVLLVAKRERLQPGDDPESELTPVGLLGFADPPRVEVRPSVEEARRAGVRTVMITGDHPDTAIAIARQTGIISDTCRDVLTGEQLNRLSDDELLHSCTEVNVYARVVPEHKLRIVTALKRQGAVVAMTGDGVNDVPAMRAAHVAVAMGRRGTDAARAAADLVLTDDNYTSIVRAIRYGRTIYDNILRFTHFLLAANTGEVLVFAVAIPLGLSAPLTVIQILMVNLLTDGFPAVALGVDPPDENIMHRRPKPQREPLLLPIRNNLFVGGLVTGLAALVAFLVGNMETVDTGRTMAFTTLVLAQLLYVFGTRSEGWFFHSRHNIWLYTAVLTSAALLLLILLAPPVASRFDIVSLDATQIGVAIALSTAPLLALELFKATKRSCTP